MRAVREAFKRLGAGEVRHQLRSKVNVQAAPAQRALVSNKLEPPVKTRATRDVGFALAKLAERRSTRSVRLARMILEQALAVLDAAKGERLWPYVAVSMRLPRFF